MYKALTKKSKTRLMNSPISVWFVHTVCPRALSTAVRRTTALLWLVDSSTYGNVMYACDVGAPANKTSAHWCDHP